MFKVYWTYDYDKPASQDFPSDQMSEALKFMEQLRSTPGVAFVTFCSENPNSVGKPGVAAPSPDYNWTKRRNNERPIIANDQIEVPLDEEL